MKPLTFAGSAAAVALMVAGMTGSPDGSPATAAHQAPAHVAVHTGHRLGPETWAKVLLRAGHWPVTPCNLGGIEAWEKAEGGAWVNRAARNPLNDARPTPGSWLMPGHNPAHVQSYPDWAAGLVATLRTLHGPDYGPVRRALRAGDSAQRLAGAVAASPWGTKPFKATCTTGP